MRPSALWKLARIALGVPEASILDLRRTIRGFRFSLDAMWEEASSLDLHHLVPALGVPVLFLLGRNDHWVPPEVSVAYFDALTAPSKKLVWFEESGHEPFADEPAKFNAALRSAALYGEADEPATDAEAAGEGEAERHDHDLAR